MTYILFYLNVNHWNCVWLLKKKNHDSNAEKIFLNIQPTLSVWFSLKHITMCTFYVTQMIDFAQFLSNANTLFQYIMEFLVENIFFFGEYFTRSRDWIYLRWVWIREYAKERKIEFGNCLEFWKISFFIISTALIDG